MAKVRIKKIEIVALQQDAKNLLRLLQREGVVQIFKSEETSSAFSTLNGQVSLRLYESHLATVREALAAVDSAASHRANLLESFTGREELTEQEFARRARNYDEIYHLANEITLRIRAREQEQSALLSARQNLERYLPWESLDIPMKEAGTLHTEIFIGSLPFTYDESSLAIAVDAALLRDESSASAESQSIPYTFSIVSSSKEQTCIALLCHRDDGETMRGALRSLGFVLPTDPTSHLPALRISKYRARIDEAQKKTEEIDAYLASCHDRRADLLFLSDYLAMKIERYRALDEVLFSKKTIFLEGYLPEREAERITNKLDRAFTTHIEVKDPLPDEEIPVLLKNNAFASPVEDITAAYSLPSKADVDPNPVMAFFYYLFFGMMLSDAAYGVLMVAGISFLLLFRKPEGQARQNLLKFLYCGLSTIFWGAMFGSWFGNVVYTVSTTFFGHTVSLNPVWFDPVHNPLQLLIFSLILGFCHVMAGMILKFYMLCKQGNWKDALLDIGMWWVVFAGIFILLLSLIFPGMPVLQNVGLWVMAAGGAGLILTQGRSSKSIAGKIIGGIASLYSITGYFSDVLSYSRLMALGLVTGIIGNVVNTIGSIGGRSVVGVIMFILVFLFGHSINIGINALGAYVHGNRLQYVEFFSKFYEGGGKPFMPLTMNTKHYKLKEDK